MLLPPAAGSRGTTRARENPAATKACDPNVRRLTSIPRSMTRLVLLLRISRSDLSLLPSPPLTTHPLWSIIVCVSASSSDDFRDLSFTLEEEDNPFATTATSTSLAPLEIEDQALRNDQPTGFPAAYPSLLSCRVEACGIRLTCFHMVSDPHILKPSSIVSSSKCSIPQVIASILMIVILVVIALSAVVGRVHAPHLHGTLLNYPDTRFVDYNNRWLGSSWGKKGSTACAAIHPPR